MKQHNRRGHEHYTDEHADDGVCGRAACPVLDQERRHREEPADELHPAAENNGRIGGIRGAQDLLSE